MNTSFSGNKMNVLGRRVSTTDGSGTVYHAYDGVRTEYLYDVEGRVAERTQVQPSPVTTLFEYDGLGREVYSRVTNRVERLGYLPILTEYDILGRVAAKSDRLGNWTRTAYSPDGNVAATTYPNGSTRVVSNLWGRAVSVTGTAVTPEFYTYGVTADGLRWTRTVTGETPDSPRFRTVYRDMLGRAVREDRSGCNGAVLTDNKEYGKLGRLLRQRRAGKPVLEITYNQYGLRKSYVEYVGNEWRSTNLKKEYLFHGNHLCQSIMRHCCASGRPGEYFRRKQTITLLNGFSQGETSREWGVDEYGTTNEYWTVFNENTKTFHSFQCSAFASNFSISVSQYGKLIQEVSRSCVTNSYSYDGLGRLVAWTDGRGNTVTQSYDEIGMLKSTRDCSGGETQYCYDQYGEKTLEIDSLGGRTEYRYDLRGRKIMEGGAVCPVLYEYDIYGHRTSVTTFRDQTGGGDKTSFIYDHSSGRMLTAVRPDGGMTEYSYDSGGKLIAKISNSGTTTLYSYDGWGNQTNIFYSDGTHPVSLFFNSLGEKIRAIDAGGVSEFSYDTAGTLTNESHSGIVTYRLDHLFDIYGRSSDYSLDGVRKKTILYDTATGRVLNINGFQWNYLHGSDLKETLTYPGGKITRWRYEDRRDILETVSNDNHSVYQYMNDLSGKRLSCNGTRYAYNMRGELISVINSNISEVVECFYDLSGNRTKICVGGVETVFVADCMNRYAGVGDFIPEYDEDSNQTLIKTESGVWSVEYNADGRPVKFSQGGRCVSICYDQLGRMIWRKVFSDSVLTDYKIFIYDGYQCIRIVNGVSGEQDTDLLWGGPTGEIPLLLSVSDSTNGTHYIYSDGNRNVVGAFSTGGDISKFEYDAFGKILLDSEGQAFMPPMRFSSEYYDSELALVSYCYRFYNPLENRWMAHDPLGGLGGANAWSMLGNDAVSFFDFLGLYKVRGPYYQLKPEMGRRGSTEGQGWTSPENGYETFGAKLTFVEENITNVCDRTCADCYRYIVRLKNRLDFILTGKIIIELPEWEDYSSATPEEQAAWNAFLAALTLHEKKHKQIYESYAGTGMDLTYESSGCNLDDVQKQTYKGLHEMATVIMTGRIEYIEKLNEEYDTETNHGESQGVYLPDL